MTSPNASEPAPGDVANFGLVRPPRVYLAAIVLGLALHWIWPVGWIPAAIGVPIGAAVALAAIALFIWAVRTFRAAGTPVPGNLPATAFVTHGPYRFSRNPIYLAFTLFHFGFALALNSLALLLTLVPAVALLALVVIPREERYLERRFPSEYPPYRASVRRWL